MNTDMSYCYHIFQHEISTKPTLELNEVAGYGIMFVGVEVGGFGW